MKKTTRLYSLTLNEILPPPLGLSSCRLLMPSLYLLLVVKLHYFAFNYLPHTVQMCLHVQQLGKTGHSYCY